MKLFAEKIFALVLPLAVLLLSSNVLAHEESQVNQPADARPELSLTVPDLADIIPLAAKLSGRLADLENKVKGGPDISALDRKFTGVESNLKGPAGQLQQLKDSRDRRYTKLVELKEEIELEKESFEDITKPLNEAILQLGAWRSEWLAEKQRWNQWQSVLLKEGALDRLEAAFAKTDVTIEAALNLIRPQLEAMLTVQEKAGNIHTRLNALAAELDSLLLAGREGVLLEKFPPMFSPTYFSQFSSGLWYAVQKGLNNISWPDSQFFARHGWTVFIQGLVSLVVIVAIFRNRQKLNDSKHWRFLAARPISGGFFLGVMTTLAFYEYVGIPAMWKLAYTVVGLISFARLTGALVDTTWKRQFVYGLITVLIVTRLLNVVGLPLPLYRIYTVLAALVGLIFWLRWAVDSRHHKDFSLYTWLLRLGSVFFVIIIMAEIWGKEGLAEYLFVSLIRTITVVLVFMLFMHMIHGGLEWLFRTSPLRRATVLYKDTDAIIRRAAIFIDVTLCGLLLLPLILMIWRIYGNLQDAIKGLWAFGFNLGSQRISVGLVIVSVGILYGAFLVSWILQKLLVDEVLVTRRMEMGVRVSIGRLVHYVLIFVGFVLALLVLGFEFTKLTILLSALGVGIGFGLQAVVNNFISGLILLFERPVRVGDYIEFGGNWSEIKRIGLRATTVQTFDHADVIIPNGDLINNQVTNWTLSNRLVRIHIPVGVAHGSDVSLVMNTLMTCAAVNPKVAKTPAPYVLFLNFGESSLDFELRVWAVDADEMLFAKSELLEEIDRSFRQAGIVIAFPQRDLHLRSTDESAVLQYSETNR